MGSPALTIPTRDGRAALALLISCRMSQYIKLNIAKSFRAPAINELTSNGLNIGSNAFQLGNSSLKAEQGYQIDLAYGFRAKDISFELEGFYNHVTNFIFADRTDSILQGYPVYDFVSSNTAILTGINAYFNVHPASAKWLEWKNRFSYIYSWLPNATDSTDHLPWIPAPHLHSEVKLTVGDTYFRIGVAHYWAQNNIYRALSTEVPSADYTLIDAGFGTQLVNRKSGQTVCAFYLNCTNLTNIAYADHLNLAQYFDARNGGIVTVTNQREGVFNMGRDVTVKVIFPFGSYRKNP